MKYRKSSSTLATVLGLLLCCQLVNAQASDDTALRDLTRKFLEAFQEKNVEKLVSLWNAKSPDLATFTAAMKQKFGEVGAIQLENSLIRQLTIEGDQAVIGITVDIRATDLKSGQPAAGFGRVNRTLRFVKEEGSWKLWRYGPTEDDLASSLMSAKTEQERLALLAPYLQ